ncbi:MAG: recombination regulator RecX [Symbiobacteriaceae bacterium]|nr:recombination regulator RecX [Symbiobacteriaceae bacterium]
MVPEYKQQRAVRASWPQAVCEADVLTEDTTVQNETVLAVDDDGYLQRRVKETDPELCWRKAMQLLSRQDYTRKLLLRKLAESFTCSAVEHALLKAEEHGYLNDAYYAERFIDSRKKDKSRQEVRNGLHERGLKEYDDLLELHYTLDEEQEVARICLAKQLRRLGVDHSATPESEQILSWQQRRKLFQALMRRGFSYLTIENVLREL